MDIFIDPVVPRPALLIIGASPSAPALAALATEVFTSEYLGQTSHVCCAGCQHSFEKLRQHYLQSGEGSA